MDTTQSKDPSGALFFDAGFVADLVRRGLGEMGLADKCPAAAPDALERYAQLLLEKNQVMNLTAITNPRDVAALHMLDCAAVLGVEDLAGKTLADVGTGAGFPGLVLALLVPSLQVTLLDALDKRILWLRETAAALGAEEHTVCLHARAEEAGRKGELRQSFDVVTSRAVADLRILSELCLPLVRVGGVFLAMKGPDCQRELQGALPAIGKLGGKLEKVEMYTIPGTSVQHAVVVVRKVGGTPAAYPRRWAAIQKKPM